MWKIVFLSLLLLQVLPANYGATTPAAGNLAQAGSHKQKWHSPCGERFKVVRPFSVGANKYAAGQHRGIDITANSCKNIVAPTDAVVHFAGEIAGRGVLSLSVSSGEIISFEPINTDLHAGDSVTARQQLGTVSEPYRCGDNCVYVGVRKDGKYINPIPYFYGLPKLLPWDR